MRAAISARIHAARLTRVATGVAVGALAMALAACGSSTPSSSGGGGNTSSTSAGSSGPPSLSSLKGSTLTVTSWGGVWTSLEQKYLYGPFTKDTGIKVQIVTNGSDPAIPAILQEQQGNVSIDLVEPLNPVEMIQKGYVSKFPSWLTAAFAKYFRPGTYTDTSVDIGNTASVIACNPAVMKKCPLTPAQFFDTKDYPGPRAIVNDPTEAIPMALEALGVPGSQIAMHPDVNKAMAELRKIKPYVSVWPSSGSQQQQVLIDKQVGAEILWNGRAYVVKQQNIHNLIISWQGSLLPEPNGFVIPKGAPNAAAAEEYFYWLAQHPQNQAEWTNGITYPTPGKTVASYLPKAVVAALPINEPVLNTSNFWFASHAKQLETVWQSFLG